MTAPPSSNREKRVVGVVPWLPWPLSGMAMVGTSHVGRGRRLAPSESALAGCLLLDILFNLLPGVDRFRSSARIHGKRCQLRLGGNGMRPR